MVSGSFILFEDVFGLGLRDGFPSGSAGEALRGVFAPVRLHAVWGLCWYDSCFISKRSGAHLRLWLSEVFFRCWLSAFSFAGLFEVIRSFSAAVKSGYGGSKPKVGYLFSRVPYHLFKRLSIGSPGAWGTGF